MRRVKHRSSELAIVEAFVDGISQGAQTLLLEGEAGIGKTTLAEAAIDRGRTAGFRIVTARIGQPETDLPYSALGNLFDRLPEAALDALPAPQREALDVALLRAVSRETGQDPRAVALATLAVVRAAATERPLLMALDDIQWIDQSSAHVIAFILRRLEHEPVGVVATRRSGDDSAHSLDLEHLMSPDRLIRLEVGPVSHDAFRQILLERLNAQLPRPVTVKIHQQVGGNPFFGQEIAREILRRGVAHPGTPLPVPKDAIRVVRARVEALPEATRTALAAVALAARPTVDLLRSCLPDVDVEQALAEAERAALIVVGSGRLSFVHPLFSSAVVGVMPAPDLRMLHGRLAAAVDTAEEHARHLALSTVGPDDAVAGELDQAAHSARRRGAVAEAAELALLAREYTPAWNGAGLARRNVTAGLLAFEAGDVGSAHNLLEQALETIASGPLRAQVMNQACEISWQDTVRVETLATRALAEAGHDRAALSSAHMSLAWTWVYRGDLAQASRHAVAAHELAIGLHDAGARTDALTVRALTAFLTGEPHAELLEQAIRLQDSAGTGVDANAMTVYSPARVVRGLLHFWEGDLTRARDCLTTELAGYETSGRYLARDEILCYLAHVGCRSGNWAEAALHAEECLEIDSESGHLRGRGQNIVPHAWLAALRGDLETARREASEGLELSLGFRDLLAATNARGVLGFAALSVGDADLATTHLRPVVEFLRDSGTVQPGLAPFVGDAVEALVAAGHLDEAQRIVDDDRLTGRAAPHPQLHASPQRGAGLLQAARGDLAGAAVTLESALAAHATSPQPFERARTLLALGEVERRRKQRAQAAAHLLQARTEFESLGAALWAAQAATALARTTSSKANGQDLSPTEQRLALLISTGVTNSEAAERMFISVKTVEANLSRIYRKLGVRSRSELTRKFAQLDPG